MTTFPQERKMEENGVEIGGMGGNGGKWGEMGENGKLLQVHHEKMCDNVSTKKEKWRKMG